MVTDLAELGQLLQRLELDFLGWLQQVGSSSSIFIYGLTMVPLHLQSLILKHVQLFKIYCLVIYSTFLATIVQLFHAFKNCLLRHYVQTGFSVSLWFFVLTFLTFYVNKNKQNSFIPQKVKSIRRV